MGFHQALKTKFIEGNAGFMSLVAIALVIGLAFCIERIVYLSLSEINAKQLMRDIDQKVVAGDIEGAKELCRNTRGPVASICYQGLMRINEKSVILNALSLVMVPFRQPTWKRDALGLPFSSPWLLPWASWVP